MIRSLTRRLPLLFVGFAALLLVMAFSGGAAVATEDSGKNDSQKFRKADDYGEKDDGYGCDDEDSDDSGKKKWKKKYHSKDSHDSDSKWKKDCSKDSDSDDSDKKKWTKKYHSKDSDSSHWKKAKYSRHGGKHDGRHPVKKWSRHGGKHGGKHPVKHYSH